MGGSRSSLVASVARQRRRWVVAVVGTALGAAMIVPVGGAGASPSHGLAGAGVATPAALHQGPRLDATASLLTRSQGQRMRAGGTRATSYSTNWSGLGGAGTGIQGAGGHWVVPAVVNSPTPRYSATWVGVDGLNNSNLIQTGTSQDTTDGYFAWIEILPANESPIVDQYGNPAVVRSGDQITASVAEASAGIWTIYLSDSTQNWYFEQNFYYYGPGQSAEWIEEAPTVNGVQSSPANFGTAHVTGTAVYGNGVNGLGWYSTNLNATNEIAMVNQTHTLAMPSAPSLPTATGQSFNDTYVVAPSPPSHVTATPGKAAVALSWSPPASTGGAPIGSYYVRVYRAGILMRTVTVTSTSTTLGSLISGAAYSFSVAAHSSGNYTSLYTAKTAVVRPT